jgi:hypothetical protein
MGADSNSCGADWQGLPTDVLSIIAESGAPDAFANMRQVCRQWRLTRHGSLQRAVLAPNSGFGKPAQCHGPVNPIAMAALPCVHSGIRMLYISDVEIRSGSLGVLAECPAVSSLAIERCTFRVCPTIYVPCSLCT